MPADDEVEDKLFHVQDDRIFYIAEAFRRGFTLEEVNELTKINVYFLDIIKHIVELEAGTCAQRWRHRNLENGQRTTDTAIIRSAGCGTWMKTRSVHCAMKIRFCRFIKWLTLALPNSNHTLRTSTAHMMKKTKALNQTSLQSSSSVLVRLESDRASNSTMRRFTASRPFKRPVMKQLS